MNDYMEQFLSEIGAAGLPRPDKIEADGALHRFATNGKHGDDSGWYCLHTDNIPAGAFGCWRTGISQTWRANIGRDVSPAESHAHRKQMNAIKEARMTDELKRHAEAATKAAQIWDAAQPASENHPYTARKDISVYGLREHKDQLVVPMRDADGALCSLQFIAPDGQKRFLTGGRVKGCFYMIGEPAAILCVCEGLATGTSVHAATGHAVAVAFNAGNLEPVARALRAKYPKVKIIICGDTDHSGVGQKAALDAASAIGGSVALPEFSAIEMTADHPPTDFNDLSALRGLEAVKALIHGAECAPRGDAPETASEPEPLRATMPPAAAYPVDALGGILGDAAKAMHESVMAPLGMCCQLVLAAASLAVQAHFDVLLPWGERKPLSLFLLTVGESGERKSSIDDLVLGAAKAQERADMKTYTAEAQRYESELAAWKQASDAAGKAVTSGKKGAATASDVQAAIEKCGEKPQQPVAPLRFVSDPTVEGLYKLLATGRPSVALFSDEGGLLIGGHALNSDNALKTMARWCKLWDGAPFDRVRSGDGAGVLYGRRMALHQLAQPEVMTILLSDRMANGQGLLARCLTCWPQSSIGTRHVAHFEWAGNRPEMKRLYANLKALMEAPPKTSGNNPQELDPAPLLLSDSAKALAVLVSNQFESLMARGADLAELRDRTSKALENACRIAGVLAVVEGGMATRSVELEHLQRGLSLVQWYLAEALRMRGASSAPQAVLDAETLSAWLTAKGLAAFRSKQVLNTGPNPLRNKPRLMAAIGELVSCGYLAANAPGAVVDGVPARTSWSVLHVV